MPTAVVWPGTTWTTAEVPNERTRPPEPNAVNVTAAEPAPAPSSRTVAVTQVLPAAGTLTSGALVDWWLTLAGPAVQEQVLTAGWGALAALTAVRTVSVVLKLVKPTPGLPPVR